MYKLHDDPHLRLLELNRINALLDKSLDYAWELSHGGNREKHEITIDKDNDMHGNRYTDIMNDKLDLVHEIGELIDSYMSDGHNIVDVVNKSHNNSSANDILAEDLKKCKDTILKMINSSNVCAKQDTKKNDADNVNVCDKEDINNDKADTNNNDKPDTKVKDKPDTKKKDTKKKDANKKDSKLDAKVNDKPDTKKKDTKKKDAQKKDSKPDTKVKDKPDTKVKDKEDIESSASKNEPQKTLSNGEPAKIFDSIKEILKYFVYEKL